MFSFYNIEDGTCLLAVEDEGNKDLLLTRDGRWKDGTAAALDYLYKGESGAEKMEDGEALALAAKLGGKWPPSPG